MSSEGWQEGALSRWTVAPRPGEMGGEKQLQREIEATSTVERCGAIRDRYGEGRNGMNDPVKGRRYFGVEGLDKSIIVKERQSLGFEESLTEAWEKHPIIWLHYLPPENG